jgi:signal transduction histidine kinase/HAMP domain-containing protein
MKLSTRLWFAAWVPFLMAVLIAAALAVGHRASRQAQADGEAIRRIVIGVNELNVLAHSWLLTHHERDRIQFMAEQRAVMLLVDALRRGGDEEGLLDAIRHNGDRMKEAFLRLVANQERLPSADDSPLHLAAEIQMTGQMRIRAHEMTSDAQRMHGLINARIREIQRRITSLILALLGVTTLTVTVVLATMMRRISQALDTLRRGTEMVAAGRLDHRVGTTAADELGDLSRAFDAMTGRLREVTVSKEVLQLEIKERQRIEQEVLAAHERARWLARFPDENPSPVLRVSAAGEILYRNAAAAGAPGWAGEVGEALPAPLRGLLRCTIAAEAAGQEDVELGGRSYSVAAAPFLAEGYVNLYGVDITQRRVAEKELVRLNEELEWRVGQRTEEARRLAEQLRGLAVEVCRTEQRERLRLSCILHDHVQQLLVAARMHLELVRLGGTAEAVASATQRVDAILKDVLEATRTLAVDLSPPALRERGLIGGLNWLAARMAEIHRFQVSLALDPGAVPVSEETQLMLFECVRELLLNARKHSGCDRATVTLSRGSDDRVDIVVGDEGRGFSPRVIDTAPPGQSTFGLFSIQQRLYHLGGTMEIESVPGKGTRIRISVPFEPAIPPVTDR